jgi:NADPH:quinone reductase-like Zn-dependent oxidoreductase
MKAVRLLEYGGQLVFNDIPTPTIARDEILVKIRSTAVNHLDLVEASGNGKIERFDCYPALNIMLKQMGVPPDFASAVKRSTQR